MTILIQFKIAVISKTLTRGLYVQRHKRVWFVATTPIFSKIQIW